MLQGEKETAGVIIWPKAHPASLITENRTLDAAFTSNAFTGYFRNKASCRARASPTIFGEGLVLFICLFYLQSTTWS